MSGIITRRNKLVCVCWTETGTDYRILLRDVTLFMVHGSIVQCFGEAIHDEKNFLVPVARGGRG